MILYVSFPPTSLAQQVGGASPGNLVLEPTRRLFRGDGSKEEGDVDQPPSGVVRSFDSHPRGPEKLSHAKFWLISFI